MIKAYNSHTYHLGFLLPLHAECVQSTPGTLRHALLLLRRLFRRVECQTHSSHSFGQNGRQPLINTSRFLRPQELLACFQALVKTPRTQERLNINFFHKVKVGGRGRGWCALPLSKYFEGRKKSLFSMKIALWPRIRQYFQLSLLLKKFLHSD